MLLKYVCGSCGYICDEASGDPERGIARGIRWADVSDDWMRPDCGVAKSSFARCDDR
jgi:rubredoxin